MSSPNKIDLLRDFAEGVYLSETQNTIPFPPPPNALYTCIQYTYSPREGGEGERVEPERRGEGQQVTNRTTLNSIFHY